MLNPFGRIAACGMIADYNEPQPGPDNLFLIVGKKLTVRGLHRQRPRAPHRRLRAARRPAAALRRDGLPRDGGDGIERIFDAFVGMLRGGGHTGKLVIKV